MAGQEGFEPPTCGFGDRRSAVGATGLRYEALLGFAMSRMLLVPGTILLDFKTTGSVLLVLHRGVVATLALSAGEQDIHPSVFALFFYLLKAQGLEYSTRRPSSLFPCSS